MRRRLQNDILLIFAMLSVYRLICAKTEDSSICRLCNCSHREINCRNLKLNKSFSPEDWQNLTNGQTFVEAYFDNNFIGHLTAFPHLPFVRLSFQNNRLVKIDDRAFKALTHLQELDLSHNELTSINLLPTVFEGPYNVGFYEPLNLTILDLSANELHTLHQDLFEHLPYLERLYLKQNPFKIMDRPTVLAISSLPNLKILDLSYTKLRALPSGFLHTPKKLYELVLMGNQFSEIPSDVLVESHDLKILNLNENPIKTFSSERPFPEMPSLKQLHVSLMPNLTRIEKGSLGGLLGLSYLYCRMNEKLEYFSPGAFIRNGSTEEIRLSLTTLDISDNNLRYIDRELLKPIWTTVKHINILGNPLVCDCENQWIVSELIPLMQNTSSPTEGLVCGEPSAMRGQRLVTLSSKNYTMRCLDIYGNHPENDGPILVSTFVVLVVVLLIVLGLGLWLKNNKTCRPGGRANYHRAFYRPATQQEYDKY